MDFAVPTSSGNQPHPPEQGPCGVCGETTALQFRDRHTDIVFGQCCYNAMVTAGNLLDRYVAHGVLAHPLKSQI